MEHWVLISAIFLFAGFIQSFTGFGFALVATPLLFFLLDPKMAIVVVVCLGGVSIVVMTVIHRQSVDLRRVLYLSLGSVIGIPLGAYILLIIPQVSLKLVIAFVIIVLTFLLVFNRFPYLKPFGFWHLFIGFCSGLLNSSTSMGGPPMVLFLLSQKVTKVEFLGTISATFIILTAFTLGTFIAMDMVDTEILKIAGTSLPALAMGFLIGTRATKKVNNHIFRYITCAIVFTSAIMTIVTTLAGR